MMSVCAVMEIHTQQCEIVLSAYNVSCVLFSFVPLKYSLQYRIYALNKSMVL